MSQKAITINTPAQAQAHITAEDDAFIYNSLLGGVSGILGELDCVRVNDNAVRLSGGGVSNKGYILRIPDGEQLDLTIENGTANLKRHDIVAARFTKGSSAVADSHEIVVIKGTPSASPQSPILSTSALSAVGDVNEIPLFKVKLNGTSIEGIERICPLLPQGGGADSVNGMHFFTGSAEPTGAADGDVWFVTE